MKKIMGGIGFLCVILAPHIAGAATCGNLTNPILFGVTGVAFGSYSPSSPTNTTATGMINVTCTVTLSSALPSFTIALSGGNANSFPRQMSFLTQQLTYNLYTSSSYATVWGDGTASTVTQSYTAGAASTSFTVYGSMPKAQFPSVGLYGDTITVTVTY